MAGTSVVTTLLAHHSDRCGMGQKLALKLYVNVKWTQLHELGFQLENRVLPEYQLTTEGILKHNWLVKVVVAAEIWGSSRWHGQAAFDGSV
ncbi:hypothetical protein C5167_017246 [Papaver somniferum]|uniref:Uncharacterized protein n=1 Tax=Papaver somniferum TaxID=3469 RepID=A0A4Y7IL39_PAPSO|nr:hypothetical protein C5167_017246 [Papaver somniferum]